MKAGEDSDVSEPHNCFFLYFTRIFVFPVSFIEIRYNFQKVIYLKKKSSPIV